MNIKSKISKLVSGLLCFSMIFSNVLPAYAADAVITENTLDGEDLSVNERNLEDITVTYKQASSFFVTIPKTIVLDGWKQSTYAVKASGDIDAEQCVYVAPVDGIADTENIDFYMKDQASENAKDDVVANVTHNKFHWNATEVAAGHKQADNLVEAPDLTAGAWKGIFQMEIKLETNAAQGGEDSDPYDIAPENEYSDWQYRLDEENGTIGLMGYNGSAKDVVVYDNYQIDGKIYKTKVLGSMCWHNGEYSVASSYYMFANEPVETVVFGDNVDFTDMTETACMFYNCQYLESIDWGKNFDTSNVTNMYRMFYDCKSLTNIDLSKFDTSNVTNIQGMFEYCQYLTSLDVSNFDTSNVTNMSYMFYQCAFLPNLDLSKFDTSNVTTMQGMFGCCTSITSLDLCSFDTSKVTDMREMFRTCRLLENIYVTEGKWVTEQVTNNAFMFFESPISSVTYK